MVSDDNRVELVIPLLLNTFVGAFFPLSKRMFLLCHCHRVKAGRKLKRHILQIDLFFFLPISLAELPSSRILT